MTRMVMILKIVTGFVFYFGFCVKWNADDADGYDFRRCYGFRILFCVFVIQKAFRPKNLSSYGPQIAGIFAEENTGAQRLRVTKGVI